MPRTTTKSLPPLTDDLVLLDSGLDSLAIAILVARLEETLGFDPFTESDDMAYPVTLGDFIRFYEHAAECPWRRFETGWLTRRRARSASCGVPRPACRLGDVLDGTSLGGRVAELAGRSVLVATRDQFAAALALIELDGVARRLIICTPDLPAEHLPAVVAKAGVDAIVSDHDERR